MNRHKKREAHDTTMRERKMKRMQEIIQNTRNVQRKRERAEQRKCTLN